MKIALAQFNPTVGDFDGNSARILELARDAKSRGADVAVFTELCLCGYPPQDLVERPAFLERNQIALAQLAKGIPLPSIVGYVGRAQDNTGKPAANSAALIADGRIVFSSSAKCSCPPTMYSTSRAISNPPIRKRHSAQRRAARHHHLRRLLERQNFLAAAPLRPRSCRRTRREGKYRPSEYLRLSLHDGQARLAPRHAEFPGPRTSRSSRVRESGGRQRQPRLRRIERRHHARRPHRRAGQIIRRRPRAIRHALPERAMSIASRRTSLK